MRTKSFTLEETTPRGHRLRFVAAPMPHQEIWERSLTMSSMSRGPDPESLDSTSPHASTSPIPTIFLEYKILRKKQRQEKGMNELRTKRVKICQAANPFLFPVRSALFTTKGDQVGAITTIFDVVKTALKKSEKFCPISAKNSVIFCHPNAFHVDFFDTAFFFIFTLMPPPTPAVGLK